MTNHDWVNEARCPACETQGARRVGGNVQVTLVACPECTLIYSHPQPRERVRVKYLGQYDLATTFDAMEPRKRALFRRRLQGLPDPAPGADRLCDVGCAGGQFLELASEIGWRPFGIEFNPPAVQRARERGAQVWMGMLEELDDLPWGTFPLVTSWDVLEHTPDPLLFAERLVRLLAPQGVLTLTTLNVRSLAYRWFGTRWSMVGEDHFTYWNRISLTRLFGKFGLATEAVHTFGLGRDFVTAIDHWRTLRSAKGLAPGQERDDSPVRTSAPDAWDVNPAVLAAENALNRIFRLAGGGVGIGVRLRKLQ